MVTFLAVIFPFQHSFQTFKIGFGQMFDADEFVSGIGDGADEFVKLCLDRGPVAILSVLDQEDHEKGHDRRARVDDELPGVGIMEDRPGQYPADDRGRRQYERQGLPGPAGDAMREGSENFVHVLSPWRPIYPVFRL